MKTVKYGSSDTFAAEAAVAGSFVSFDDMDWYEIRNYDSMPPFFMSVTSPEDFWMFISSSGGLSCGRVNSDNALFPYLCDDKVTESHRHTGPYTLIRVSSPETGGELLWKPLDADSPAVYDLERTLYKTVIGDRLMFEEKNRSLGLRFRMIWETSPKYGFHRKCELTDLSGEARDVYLLDGIRNLLPAGVTNQTQGAFSNLLNAYKRSETETESGLGIFALSATLTDRAEPSESLRATSVWSWGLDDCALLLSELQLPLAERGGLPLTESDIKGERAAYLRSGRLALEAGGSRAWGFASDLRQSHSDLIAIIDSLKTDKDAVVAELSADVSASHRRLDDIIELNDGFQDTGSLESQAHHKANVLFNVMRGGYFLDGYGIRKADFIGFVARWNAQAAGKHRAWLEALPVELDLHELRTRASALGDPDILRLTYEFLPLTFGRRHGDPSRPWNQFEIQTRDEAGQQLVGYQGNWRDIFQNWEALCFSFPDFYPSVIAKFLNAVTPDGYNPYKISQDGIAWEVPNPDDPWANIGYWSDHQIIYLSKLIEQGMNFFPESIAGMCKQEIFVHADVPYRIAGFDALLENPYDSIAFQPERHAALMAARSQTGADGCLLRDADGAPVRSGMIEKLLILFLAKLSNYVPGGGIWMNTQRPEWNDANNALAGWGLSMVTLSYLIRFIGTLSALVKADEEYLAHPRVAEWFESSLAAMTLAPDSANSDPAKRMALLRSLGTAASEYRSALYERGMGKGKTAIKGSQLLNLLKTCDAHFRATAEFARRDDGSFESYQVMQLAEGQVHIKKLYPMLEGQVAGLSVPGTGAEASVRLLDALRSSELYRADQHSYMLYPNRELPGFLEKNSLSADKPRALAAGRDADKLFAGLLERDKRGSWHFNADFRNGGDLEAALAGPGISPELTEADGNALKQLFEECFSHSEFTGRSGTFFAYEGLGSIYWHMVSKSMLAVQERLVEEALASGPAGSGAAASAPSRAFIELKQRYEDIRKGIGFNKSADVYGAFPIDPYSHSPFDKGAKQPGMTGQVKEEILARFAELGMIVQQGCIRFLPELILEDQWKADGSGFSFSYCGIPFSVEKGAAAADRMEITIAGGDVLAIDGLSLSREISSKIFRRETNVRSVRVLLK